MVTIPLVLVAVAALLVGAFFVLLLLLRRNSPHKPLFTEQHSLEFFSSVSQLRESLTATGRPAEGPREASFVTSAGLFVLYSIQPVNGRVLHHYSISSRGGRIAFAAGGLFAALLAQCLEIDTRGLGLAYSTNAVTHAAFLADTAIQSAALKRPMAVPGPSEMQVLFKAAAAKRDAAIAEAMQCRSEEDLVRRVLARDGAT